MCWCFSELSTGIVLFDDNGIPVTESRVSDSHYKTSIGTYCIYGRSFILQCIITHILPIALVVQLKHLARFMYVCLDTIFGTHSRYV